MHNPAQYPLQLHNTLTRGKEVFIPRQEGRVKLFTCGPSIYSSPHIGNYRTFLFEDILQRYLEYLGYTVQRLINFTDVEDKSIAAADGSMEKLQRITEESAGNFYRNAGLLHIKIPDFVPRSSTSVDQAVHLIKHLLAKGFAYWLGRDVFFDPLKQPGFGRLYGLDMRRWPKKKVRFRRDTYEGNRWNLGDFILWHGYRPQRDGEIYWQTDLGQGRPAWNVQDPAMISRHLGYEIDIHCGGIDNLYRHHDYNIAVIEAASGRTFANYWLHGEHVLLNGKKISKSKGNIIYPQDLLNSSISGAGIRFYLFSEHYRQKLDLSEEMVREKEKECRRLQSLARLFSGPLFESGTSTDPAERHINGLGNDFAKAMSNDLDVAGACAALLRHLEKLRELVEQNSLGREQWEKTGRVLRSIDSVLQILYI